MNNKIFLGPFFLVFLTLSGCTKSEKSSANYGLELSATLYTKNNLGVIQQLENDDNVLVPYIAERFGLKIKEILEVPSDFAGKPAQAALMWAASKVLPDIMASGAEEFGSLVNTNLFRPLDEYLAKMPNYNEAIPPRYWPREANPVDGKTYGLYGLNANWPPDKKIDSDDIVSLGRDFRSLWVREDILAAIGYSFTPVDELRKETVDQRIRPTAEQLRLDPPIDSPEAFLDLLRKIKNSGFKAPDGSDIIPFTMPYWEAWHLSVMFDNGYWRTNKAGEVDGYLGLPGFHDFMKWLWTAYREELIDQDFLVQKSVQMQEKVTAGRVAAGEYIPNSKIVFEQMQQNIPGAALHPIPFPKTSADTGFFDTSSPFSYARILINKKVPDDVMSKIAELLDWLYSDEGKEVIAWGPESAGLYYLEDGVRYFQSPELKDGMLNSAQAGEGPYKYGLHDISLGFSSTPIIAALLPSDTNNLVAREYDYIADYTALIRSIVASQARFSGIPRHLEVANSDQSEEVAAVSDWYWSIFFQTYLPQLLTAANETEFEERYQQVLTAFMQETNYATAKEKMVQYFQKFPAEW